MPRLCLLARSTLQRFRVVAVAATGLIATALSLALAAPAVAAPPHPSHCRPVLTRVTIPALAYAGDKVSGTVKLSCAPSHAVKVLVSSDRSQLVVPRTVTIRPGHSSASVPLTAQLVAGDQYRAHVAARYNGRTIGDDITVNPGLRSVSIPASEPNRVTVQLSLTGSAPAEGLTVLLASDNPAITLPPTYALNAPSTGAVFNPEQIRPVTEDTKVTISAKLGTRTLSTSVVLVPPFDGTQRMSIRPDFEGDLYGLESRRTFQVTLSNPAPEGGLDAQMEVLNDDPDNPAVQLENTTSHISDRSIDAFFHLSTTDVTKTAHVILRATVLGATVSVPITIHPRITAVALPESAKSGTTFQGTVTLAGPADVDIEVFLQPSWGIVELPGPLTIPAGATSATFAATSIPIDEPAEVFITAHLGRTTTYSNPITLTP